MDETEGTTLRDSSGNQRDGFYDANGAAIVLGQPALASGNSVRFATESFAQVSGAQFPRWEDFTLSTWLSPSEVGAAPQMIFGKGDSSSGNPNFALLFSDAGLLWFVGSEPEFGSDPGVLQAGTKHHVAMSFSTAGETRVARLYVDGQVVAEQEDPNFIATGVNEPLYLGSFQGAVPMDGTLDDVQLYDRALSTEELTQLFENPGSSLATDFEPGPDPVDGEVPVLATVQWFSDGFQTAFVTEAGANYALEYSPDLTTGSWTRIGTMTGDGTEKRFADEDAGRRARPEGFYRVLIE